ncbi:MAG TPA: MarR family transcriptional regulator [Anaerolineae bacterium]|nr:MarR family transcriptional regulator [Anaerolineae bacterium]
MQGKRQAGFLIAKIHYLSGRILSRKLKHYKLNEINPGQGRILFALWQGDGITIQELAKKTSLGKSTLTSMLDRLENSGYLVRIPSKEDRRRIVIELTEKDKTLRSIYSQISDEMIDLFYGGFTNKEIEGFESYLKRVLDNLSSYEA